MKPQFETIEQLFDNTNWRSLRKQKLALCNVLGYATGQQKEHLEGLLAFIDSIQDFAADAKGYPAFSEKSTRKLK